MSTQAHVVFNIFSFLVNCLAVIVAVIFAFAIASGTAYLGGYKGTQEFPSKNFWNYFVRGLKPALFVLTGILIILTLVFGTWAIAIFASLNLGLFVKQWMIHSLHQPEDFSLIIAYAISMPALMYPFVVSMSSKKIVKTKLFSWIDNTFFRFINA